MIFRPAQAFTQLASNYNPGQLLEAFIILVLIAAVQQEPSPGGIITYFGSWLIFSSLIFLMAFIFKLKASDYPRFLSLLAFANLPLIFLAPVSIISEFSSSIGMLIKLIILIWTFNLNISAIAELCSISKMRATLIYLLPSLALVLFILNLVLGSISQLMTILL